MHVITRRRLSNPICVRVYNKIVFGRFASTQDITGKSLSLSSMLNSLITLAISVHRPSYMISVCIPNCLNIGLTDSCIVNFNCVTGALSLFITNDDNEMYEAIWYEIISQVA